MKLLINIAKGDAYGVGFEFVRDKDIKRYHKMSNYRASHLMKDKSAGCYSDDTQQSIAISELMLEHAVWDKEVIANKFLTVFKRDERMGYTNGFYQILKKASSGNELLSLINGDSINNGSAMRSVPLGWLDSVEDVLSKAEIQAKVTHDSFEGIKGSQIVALASYYLRNDVSRESLVGMIESELEIALNCSEVRRCTMNAIETAECALALLLSCNSLSEIIDRGTKAGGDVDSVLSIACGLASFCDHIEDDLAGFFEADLENGNYGRDYLSKLDIELYLKFNK